MPPVRRSCRGRHHVSHRLPWACRPFFCRGFWPQALSLSVCDDSTPPKHSVPVAMPPLFYMFCIPVGHSRFVIGTLFVSFAVRTYVRTCTHRVSVGALPYPTVAPERSDGDHDGARTQPGKNRGGARQGKSRWGGRVAPLLLFTRKKKKEKKSQTDTFYLSRQFLRSICTYN